MAIGNLLAITSHGLFSSGGSVTCDYPSEDDVRDGIVYDDGTLTGNMTEPAETDVRAGVEYGANGVEFVGTLGSPPVVPSISGASPFAAIASSIRARVMSVMNLPFALCPIAMNDRYKLTITDSVFVVMRIYGVTKPRDPALDYVDSGAGRLARPVARRVRFYVYVRQQVDSYGDDTVALFGSDPSIPATTGSDVPAQLLAEEMMFNGLDSFLPQDSIGTPLTLGPLHVLDASEEPQRDVAMDAGFARSCLDFESCYISAIAPTDPVTS